MDLLLENKVAVVTAASKGIGLAVTKALAHEGAHVVAGSRTTTSLARRWPRRPASTPAPPAARTA